METEIVCEFYDCEPGQVNELNTWIRFDTLSRIYFGFNEETSEEDLLFALDYESGDTINILNRCDKDHVEIFYGFGSKFIGTCSNEYPDSIVTTIGYGALSYIDGYGFGHLPINQICHWFSWGSQGGCMIINDTLVSYSGGFPINLFIQENNGGGITEACVLTSTNETFANEIKVYPNPVYDYLILPDQSLLQFVKIFSTDGIEYSIDITADKIVVSHLPPGQYFGTLIIENSKCDFFNFIKLQK